MRHAATPSCRPVWPGTCGMSEACICLVRRCAVCGVRAERARCGLCRCAAPVLQTCPPRGWLLRYQRASGERLASATPTQLQQELSLLAPLAEGLLTDAWSEAFFLAAAQHVQLSAAPAHGAGVTVLLALGRSIAGSGLDLPTRWLRAYTAAVRVQLGGATALPMHEAEALQDTLQALLATVSGRARTVGQGSRRTRSAYRGKR